MPPHDSLLAVGAGGYHVDGHPTDLLDALQMSAKYAVATPANWRPGQDVIIPPSVSDADARKKYPKGFKTLKWYLRTVPQPK